MRRLAHLPKSGFKVLLFSIACLVLLVALAAKIGNISLFSSRRVLYAQMSDVTGLTTGDDVDIAGVEVGQVTAITVQRAHALVTMSIDTDVPLRRGTDVGLRWENVIGQKELYLYPPSGGPLLLNGATIPLSHDVSGASVDAFLNALGPFLSAINPKEANAFVENVSSALNGDTAEIDQLIDNGATVSKTVGDLDTQVGNVIDSLDQVLTAVASRSTDVSSLVSNLQTVSEALASRNSLLDETVSNLSEVAGDLANLVTKNKATITGAVSDLKTVTQDIATHQQELAQSLATLGSGLAPYTEISSYGQWFQIQTVYSCLANQTSCSYYEPTSPPPGTGPGGSPPVALPSTSSSSGSGGASTPTPAALPASPSPAPSISSVLGTVAGAGSSGTGGSTSTAGGGS